MKDTNQKEVLFGENPIEVTKDGLEKLDSQEASAY